MTEYQEIVLKLSLAIVCGGVIGVEREKRKKMGGFRTHMLIALGSTLIMMVSQYGIFTVDPARLSAQVVSGVGFLGTGTILRDKGEISGLTTAAGLWVTAGIGLAIGHEFYFGAVITTLMVMFCLAPLSFFSDRVTKKSNRVIIEAINRMGLINDITQIYLSYEIDIQDIRFKYFSDEEEDKLIITVISDVIDEVDDLSLRETIKALKSVKRCETIT